MYCQVVIFVLIGTTYTQANEALTTTSPEGSSCTDPGDVAHGKKQMVTMASFRYIQYTCEEGYALVGMSTLICREDGQWYPNTKPRCTNVKCDPPKIHHARVEGASNPSGFPPNSQTEIRCDTGYSLSTTTGVIICQENGQWSPGDGSLVMPKCRKSSCLPPPTTMGRSYQSDSVPGADGNYPEGTYIQFFCEQGYRTVGYPNNEMRCLRGVWQGIALRCTQASSKRCGQPEEIEGGRWYFVNNGVIPFESGSKIAYECDVGNSLYGNPDLECSGGYWHGLAPRCIENGGKVEYCKDPGTIDHGSRKCDPHKDCTSGFYPGLTVHYYCDEGYELVGGAFFIKCGKDGQWSDVTPSCEESSTDNPLNDAPDHSGTLAIVIATSGSVLGILIIVLITVAIRRRKSDIHLGHPVEPPAPPYLRHCNSASSIDEHDRVALIAFADGAQVTLPSYEEAIQERRSVSGRRHADSSSHRDYRPLPRVHPSLRSMSSETSSQSSHGPGNSETTRHSVITTNSATTNRDNMSGSVNFGSIDTVNTAHSGHTVNSNTTASDGTSTTVTIGTYDSSASNPSIATSRQAAAGSLTSSTDSLATEDAPLLDHGHAGPSGSQVTRSDPPTSPTAELKEE